MAPGMQDFVGDPRNSACLNSALSIASGGCTDLPPGKIASIVTYLEMRSRPSPRARASRAGLKLVRLTGRDVARYLSIYRTLGER